MVLLDLGAGLDRAVRRMAAFADTLLVVATEEPTSLTDAYAVLKLHAAAGARRRARIVVNQAADPRRRASAPMPRWRAPAPPSWAAPRPAPA